MTERKPHTFSMDAPECQSCERYNDCKNKRRAMCAYLEPVISPSISMNVEFTVGPITAPIEVTIDPEPKKKLEDALYSVLKCSFLGGAI